MIGLLRIPQAGTERTDGWKRPLPDARPSPVNCDLKRFVVGCAG